MIVKYITNSGGSVTFDDISQIDKTLKISDIIDDLKEDLLQASFPHEQIIDIGWYPEFSEAGSFRISLIKDSNWEKPVSMSKAKNWIELNAKVLDTLKKIEI